jgi:hypothetical protein
LLIGRQDSSNFFHSFAGQLVQNAKQPVVLQLLQKKHCFSTFNSLPAKQKSRPAGWLGGFAETVGWDG